MNIGMIEDEHLGFLMRVCQSAPVWYASVGVLQRNMVGSVCIAFNLIDLKSWGSASWRQGPEISPAGLSMPPVTWSIPPDRL
jgi:hypothetical protein